MEKQNKFDNLIPQTLSQLQQSLNRFDWLNLLVVVGTFLPFYAVFGLGRFLFGTRWIQLTVGGAISLTVVVITLKAPASLPHRLYRLAWGLGGLLVVAALGIGVLYASFVYVLLTGGAMFYTVGHYLVVSGMQCGLAGLALKWGHSGLLSRLCAMMTLAAVVGFPWLIGSHTPAASAALPGYTVVQVNPPSFLQGRVKEIHQFCERTPCRYDLVGWQEDNTLVYQAQCGEDTHFWQVTPTRSHAAQRQSLPTLPKQLWHPQLSWDTRTHLRATFQAPEFLMQDLTVSPDGQWLAFVTSHSYGPEDVILISPSERAEFHALFPLYAATLDELLEDYDTPCQESDAMQRKQHVLTILFDDWEKSLGWDLGECRCFGFEIVGQGDVNGERYVAGQAECTLPEQKAQPRTAMLYTMYHDHYGVLGTYTDLSQYANSTQ